ncbi:MAG: nicotinate-nucleotide adenylyltransferase [Bacteroidales bacterium]|jgi:nicotinate-nucleotide adenylyltransferase|nr:nicotinate-nucleotide adenylyltransferase [Bacteroidales bacterium]
MPNNIETLLYFGSFNPIHIGHLAIANYFAEFQYIKEFWFIVTPQNPLKQNQNLLDDRQRKYMLELAIGDYSKFKVSDIEFYLPKPNYTINTLTYLQEKYPTKKFALLIGSDNLNNFHKWKNYKIILKNYKLFVYKRPNYDFEETFNNLMKIKNANIKIIEAPEYEISSSFIREGIKANRDMRFFLHENVWRYIQKMNFYK